MISDLHLITQHRMWQGSIFKRNEKFSSDTYLTLNHFFYFNWWCISFPVVKQTFTNILNKLLHNFSNWRILSAKKRKIIAVAGFRINIILYSKSTQSGWKHLFVAFVDVKNNVRMGESKKALRAKIFIRCLIPWWRFFYILNNKNIFSAFVKKKISADPFEHPGFFNFGWVEFLLNDWVTGKKFFFLIFTTTHHYAKWNITHFGCIDYPHFFTKPVHLDCLTFVSFVAIETWSIFLGWSDCLANSLKDWLPNQISSFYENYSLSTWGNSFLRSRLPPWQEFFAATAKTNRLIFDLVRGR